MKSITCLPHSRTGRFFKLKQLLTVTDGKELFQYSCYFRLAFQDLANKLTWICVFHYSCRHLQGRMLFGINYKMSWTYPYLHVYGVPASDHVISYSLNTEKNVITFWLWASRIAFKFSIHFLPLRTEGCDFQLTKMCKVQSTINMSRSDFEGIRNCPYVNI